MADRTILDLTTETDRPVVKIDGIGYPLRTSNDLTLENFRFLERVSSRVGTLLTRAASLKAPEELELEKRLKEIAAVALEAPPAVLRKLTAIQRIMIFKVFTELLTPTLIQAVRAMGEGQTPASLSPGTKLSPGSYASTAGLLKPGRRGRRRG
jgi:hypothetical protein